jgi:hypothetical protein
VHFDQREMLADARARTQPERQVRKPVASADGLGQESVGIEALAIAPVSRMTVHEVR